MQFRWFCRQLTETLPPDPENPGSFLYEGKFLLYSVSFCFGVNISWYLDGDFIPNERLEGATSGGCFGNGPSKFFLHDHSSLYLLRIGRLYRCPVLVQNKVILFDFLCYNNYLLQGQLMKPSVC